MRKTVSRVLGVLVVSAFIGGGWLLYRQLSRGAEVAGISGALDMLPGIAQRIRKFRRVKVENGRKVWEVSAEEARYLEEEGLVVVIRPDAAFYTEDGEEISLRSREGRLFLQDRALERVRLSGGVRGRLGPYRVSTRQAEYYGESRQVVVPGRIRLSGGGLQVRAEGLDVRLPANRLRLRGPVRMVLYPEEASTGTGTERR